MDMTVGSKKQNPKDLINERASLRSDGWILGANAKRKVSAAPSPEMSNLYRQET